MKALGSQRGYTLIELLAVLFLTAAMMGMTALYWNRRGVRLDRQASEVAAALRSARARAVLSTSFSGVQFSPEAGTYVVFDDVGPDGLWPASPGYPGADAGENNGKYDEGEPIREAQSLSNSVQFGFASWADGTTPTPDGGSSVIGEDPKPVPAANAAIVFGPRGSPTTSMEIIENVPPYFVYVTDAQTMEMRAIRVDPWVGSIRIYKWTSGAESWSY
jgi:prepilin-type N-terminal cleavage/methylation domain-containing protein